MYASEILDKFYNEIEYRLDIFDCINYIKVYFNKEYEPEATINIDPIKWLGDRIAVENTITETLMGTSDVIEDICRFVFVIDFEPGLEPFYIPSDL